MQTGVALERAGLERHQQRRHQCRRLPTGRRAFEKAAQASLDAFVKDLGSGKVQLFKGPLNYQDGKPFLKPGKSATDKQIWYMEQLLKGMGGESKAKK